MYSAKTFKIIVVGDSGTGKTSLVERLTNQTFNPDTQPTIGAEFKTYLSLIDGEQIKLNVWDTAGQERYRSVSKSYFRATCGALLVFSIDDAETFHNTERWLDDIQANALPNAAIMLVGNKCDLEDARQVTYSEALSLANRHGIQYIETSAMNDTNVAEAFQRLTRTVNDRTKNGMLKGDFSAPISVIKPVSNENTKKKGCC